MARLNGIHQSLKFTTEKEVDGVHVLPFLDVQVVRWGNSFQTTVYHEPTFTGLYTRSDSYAPTGQKLALMKSLTTRSKQICSEYYLDDEIRLCYHKTCNVFTRLLVKCLQECPQ